MLITHTHMEHIFTPMIAADSHINYLEGMHECEPAGRNYRDPKAISLVNVPDFSLNVIALLCGEGDPVFVCADR